MNNLLNENLREYIDKLRIEGYTVEDSHTTDPHLIDPMGRAVETWREGYPYPELMDREEYELEKYQLQVELLKFQYWGRTPTGSTSSSSKAVTPPARAGRSNASPNTSTLVRHVSWH